MQRSGVSQLGSGLWLRSGCSEGCGLAALGEGTVPALPSPSVQVKRVYMKANLVVHPDKVKQKGGTLEQVRHGGLHGSVAWWAGGVGWQEGSTPCHGTQPFVRTQLSRSR